MKLITIIVLLFLSSNLDAKKGIVTGLEIPRFVSLKSNDANLRVGPSVNYPIKIKYLKKNMPIEIIDEFDVWRKTRDYENNIGWLHKSLIKGDRFILTGITTDNAINIFDRPNGKILGIVKKNNILQLKRCLLTWCYILHEEINGWVNKNSVWGIYANEEYNKTFYQPLINIYWEILNKNWLK